MEVRVIRPEVRHVRKRRVFLERSKLGMAVSAEPRVFLYEDAWLFVFQVACAAAALLEQSDVT